MMLPSLLKGTAALAVVLAAAHFLGCLAQVSVVGAGLIAGIALTIAISNRLTPQLQRCRADAVNGQRPQTDAE